MSEPQKRKIHALLKHLFDKDDQQICEVLTEIAPECVQGTEWHLAPLTGGAASNLLDALNSKMEERHNGDAPPAAAHPGIGEPGS
jgi:folylpolyglutamate synthase/dihydropteroate synthase